MRSSERRVETKYIPHEHENLCLKRHWQRCFEITRSELAFLVFTTPVSRTEGEDGHVDPHLKI